MNNVSRRPLFRHLERWLVGLIMAAMAYLIEKAILRSLRRSSDQRPIRRHS